MTTFACDFTKGKRAFSSDIKIKPRKRLTEKDRKRFLHDFNVSVRSQVEENERCIRTNPIRDKIRMK